MADWRQSFSRPIYLKNGQILKTLADGRVWAIKADNGRIEFQSLVAKLLAAAEGDNVEDARSALFNAAFLTFELNMEED